MSRRIVIFLVLVLTTAALATMRWGGLSQEVSQERMVLSENGQDEPNPTAGGSDQGEKQTDQNDGMSDSLEAQIARFKKKDCVDSASLWFHTMSPSEQREFDDWLASHGFFAGMGQHITPSLDAFDDYGSYDRESLHSLAQSGDGKAQLTLATHYLNDEAFEKAAELMWQAVRQGYTQPLWHLWSVELRAKQAALDDRRLSTTHKREFMLRRFSYAMLYEHLGGPFAEHNRVNLVEQTKHGDPGDPWVPDHRDFTEIEERSHALFESLQADRIQQGLGPFQRYQPPIAEKASQHEALLLRLREEDLGPCHRTPAAR